MKARNIETIRGTGGKSSAKSDGASVYRRVRFPGICEFARAYGYHYTSVYKHLTGQRTSMTMAAKWAAWQAGRPS